MANPLSDIFKVRDLRAKILFTLGILVLSRVGTVIPVPGVDVTAVQNFFLSQSAGSSYMGITEYLDFFSGGAFSNFSIFMLGVMPYISMSILMQLLLLIFPQLKRIVEEDGGRKKIQRFTRYGTVILCLVQSAGATALANQIGAITPGMLGWRFTAVNMLTLTTGTIFLMWLGEQINARGIGNGISLLIFTGIVSKMPEAIVLLSREMRRGDQNPVFVIFAAVLFVGVIMLVIYEQQGQRKIPVHYAKRIVGRKMYGAQGNSYIPIKINPSGVIPVIFASALLSAPLQLAATVNFLSGVATWLRPNGAPYLIIYAILIILFAYFYTQVSMNPIEIAKQIRENGGSIPGVRSERMEEYLTKVLNRIVLPGAVFLALIALIPSFVINLFGFPQQVAYLMGGTSLLILVGVDLDTMSQIEGHLKMHNHDGIVKRGKLKSRNL